MTRLTVDALKPNLTKKELEEMVASGKGTIGRFGAPEIDFTKDKQFMKEFLRDNEQCAVRNYVKKTVVQGTVFGADGFAV